MADTKSEEQPSDPKALWQDQDLIQINFRVPTGIHEGLKRMADQQGMSLSQFSAYRMTEFLIEERAALRAAFLESIQKAKQQEAETDAALDAYLEQRKSATPAQSEARQKRRSGRSALL